MPKQPPKTLLTLLLLILPVGFAQPFTYLNAGEHPLLQQAITSSHSLDTTQPITILSKQEAVEGFETLGITEETHYLLIGPFNNTEDAQAEQAALEEQGVTTEVTELNQPVAGTQYRVNLGAYRNQSNTQNTIDRLRALGESTYQM